LEKSDFCISDFFLCIASSLSAKISSNVIL
jgi:hypothetical protein